MTLQTVRQVSLDYGISNRMLRYYEQIGLLESRHKDDYAYRVYDETAIKRLQQVIILRKLQIPVKQIKAILNNQDAVAVIEVFKQNIADLDERITALSAVRSILAHFVAELQAKADVHLKLDLLNDKTMLAVVGSLSFPENKIKENITMEELNKASEQLRQSAYKEVRVIYLPPVTVARAFDPDDCPDLRTEPHLGVTKSILQKFVDDVDLFRIKPDTRIFGWGDTVNGKRVYIMLATIPDDLDVPAPLTKTTFPGGLYAVHPSDPLLIDEWTENNDRYDGSSHGPGMEELINPIGAFGKQSIDAQTTGPLYIDFLHPIREMKILTEDEKNRLEAILHNTETSSEPITIDMTAMIKRGDMEVNYTDGLMIMKGDGWQIGKGMETPQQFGAPLKIELRAKTDSADVTLKYAKGFIAFNWKYNPRKLLTCDIADGTFEGHKKRGNIPLDTFVDIEWILGKDIMAIKVDGEIRYITDDCGYIQACKENPAFSLSSPVIVAASEEATVTVERLRITEL